MGSAMDFAALIRVQTQFFVSFTRSILEAVHYLVVVGQTINCLFWPVGCATLELLAQSLAELLPPMFLFLLWPALNEQRQRRLNRHLAVRIKLGHNALPVLLLGNAGVSPRRGKAATAIVLNP